MKQYTVTGMSCAACSARVEKAVSKVPGVTACSVSLLTNSMGVEGTATPQAIIAAVQAAGYGASEKGAEDAVSQAGDFHWPVIIKPTDSAGSKGVTKVTRAEDIPAAAEYAKQFSKTKTFIMEEFIEKQGCSSDSDCFSIDGKLVFCSFSSQRFDDEAANPYTPSAYSWPSDMPRAVQEALRGELQRLITLLGLKTSLYNIETRLGVDGKP